jgi:hypothetical protein
MATEINRSFLSHYILFPKQAEDPKLQKRYLIQSIALGVLTLGLLHLGCLIAYSIRHRKVIPAQENTLQQLFQTTHPQSEVTKPYHEAIHPRIINTQETGKGHCGRYAINNALQKEALSEKRFLKLVAEEFSQKTGMSQEEAHTLVQNDNDFGVDADLLKLILEKQFQLQVEIQKIGDLTHHSPKQKALEAFLEGKDWAIVCNPSPHTYVLPCETHYPLKFTTGHIAALRKDADGDWWFLDSRAEKPACFPLSLIPNDCQLIA